MTIKPSILRVFSALCACLLFSTVSPSLHAATSGAHQLGAILTHGSGESTLVGVTENPDGTLSLQAEQSGHLSRLGHFTGSFDYLASIDYNTGTTFLSGDGEIRLPAGKLFVAVQIIQVGLDYPRPYTGVLRITGGTGRFAKAKGVFEITGVDEESFTDGFALVGLIVGASAK
jgi:hypothetical protein